ncbi:C6 finger domain protein [Anopheles sinensis]|uniref:C6 finger domain protein n=1 Tax=Anopheles sinensis TaxID=74873 RepID=A0A084WGP5_ANOSI|nr:C6 finger domain protein [Anopheles sinensis]
MGNIETNKEKCRRGEDQKTPGFDWTKKQSGVREIGGKSSKRETGPPFDPMPVVPRHMRVKNVVGGKNQGAPKRIHADARFGSIPESIHPQQRLRA